MKKALRLSVGQYSSAGRKSVNQDFYGAIVPKEPQLSSKGIAIAIADGISSSNVSQIASQAAINGFFTDYYCTSDAWSVKHSAQRVLQAINSWLYAQAQYSPYRFDKDKGYVCTFSALIIKSNTAHVFHIGDARIYRLIDHQLEQLTSDHRRNISDEANYLTRALGIHDHLELDYQALGLNEGDVFVLATDGVYEYLSDQALTHAIQTAKKNGSDFNELAQTLIDEALTAGSNDNLTLQIIQIEQLPEPAINEVQQQLDERLPVPSLSARMQFDGFEILREIYISSRSHVFLVKDEDSGNKLVLKTPSTEMRQNPVYLERFLMEEWIAKRINNAHVLKAVELQRKRQFLYTVTEYIEGQTLAQWMIDNPEPEINRVRDIVMQIAKGLQALHRQEMVHQDLRPNNIMIDTAGTVKLIDFGAVKVAGITDITGKEEGIMGTVQYTAPEYYLGESGTNQSDIFSLGVITYQMLSGQFPYGANLSKAKNKRAQGNLIYRPLPVGNREIPDWINHAICKATQIEPRKRYFEVSEFVFELKNPSPNYLAKAKPPLIERNPVLFWQCLSLVFLGLLLFHIAFSE